VLHTFRNDGTSSLRRSFSDTTVCVPHLIVLASSLNGVVSLSRYG